VKLNVGGAYFQTSLTTLTQVPSMFSGAFAILDGPFSLSLTHTHAALHCRAAMFSGKYLMEADEEGCYFIGAHAHRRTASAHAHTHAR
jgi:hypothetical protein